MSREHLKFKINYNMLEHEGCQGSWWFIGLWKEKGWEKVKLHSVKSSLGSMRVHRVKDSMSSQMFSLQEFKGTQWMTLEAWGAYDIFVKLHPTYAMKPGESITFYLREV